MKITKLAVAVCALLLVTACGHKGYSGGGESVSAAMEELQNKVGDRVFFSLDDSRLTPEAKATLAQQAQFMKSHSNLKFVIEGHCDERGTREYNLGLGERRANAVISYLSGLGVEESTMTPISYGKEHPAVVGHHEDAWKQNRRAVTVVK